MHAHAAADLSHARPQLPKLPPVCLPLSSSVCPPPEVAELASERTLVVASPARGVTRQQPLTDAKAEISDGNWALT